MAKTVSLTLPLTRADLADLQVGDEVLLSGPVYTMRDAGHERALQCLEDTGHLPFDLEGATLFYAGPTPAAAGRPLGSVGPTTASRMDKYAPRLLDLGLRGMIGKGKRTQQVADAIVRNKAVYFAAVGGAGALLSKCIKKADVVAYDDLGTEAIRRLEVENLPVIVVIDSTGDNLYLTAPEKYHID